MCVFFFFNDTATTEIYTLSLHDALPISIFVAYFWRQGDRHASMVALWWVAQNLWNVSVYVQDARAEQLPLVGGGEHDWNYLLGTLGLLNQDQLIGGAVRLARALGYAWSFPPGWAYPVVEAGATV